MTDEIAGFPLAFEPQRGTLNSREIVLLGIVPVGSIEQQPTGRFFWSIDLPMVRQMHAASSLAHARDRILDCLEQWFEAASVKHMAGSPAARAAAAMRHQPKIRS